jgi:hypothetical protein
MRTPKQKQFDEKLCALMPQVDKRDDRYARFRAYLKDSAPGCFEPSDEQRLVKAAEIFEKWRTQGVSDEWWTVVVPDFNKWWAMQVSKKRSEARKPKEDGVAPAATPPDVEPPKPNKAVPKRKRKRSTAKKTLGRRK